MLQESDCFVLYKQGSKCMIDQEPLSASLSISHALRLLLGNLHQRLRFPNVVNLGSSILEPLLQELRVTQGSCLPSRHR